VGVPTPFADTCAQILDEGSESLGPEADHTAIGRHIGRLRRPGR
jgi:hypothetical protein